MERNRGTGATATLAARIARELADFVVMPLEADGLRGVALAYHDYPSLAAGFRRPSERKLMRRERRVVALFEERDGSPVFANFGMPVRSDAEASPEAFSEACLRECRAGKMRYADRLFVLRTLSGSSGEGALAKTLSERARWPLVKGAHPGTDHLTREALLSSMASAKAADVVEAVEASGLSRTFLDAMRVCANGADPSYLPRYFELGPEGGRRREFALAYPYLSSVRGSVVEGALGREGPLRPELVEPSLSPAHARRFRGVTADDLGCTRTTPSPDYLFELVAATPVDWWPEDGDGLKAMARMADALGRASRSLRGDLATLAASCKGDWESFEERCVGNAGVDGHRSTLWSAISDVDDVIKDLGDRIVLPLAARALSSPDSDGDAHGIRTRSREIARRLVVSGRSLPAILEHSARWHRERGRIDGMMPAGRQVDGTWEPLFEPFRQGSVEVVFLTDAMVLREEGSAAPDRNGVPGLKHCVGGYRADAQDAVLHIASVRKVARDGSYARLSTAEIRVGQDGHPFVRQHRGWDNGAPPREAAEALETALRGNVVEERFRSTSRRSVEDEIERTCGYDWSDDAVMERALLAYAGFLPRGLRGMSPDEVSEALGLAAPDVRPSP